MKNAGNDVNHVFDHVPVGGVSERPWKLNARASVYDDVNAHAPTWRVCGDVGVVFD